MSRRPTATYVYAVGASSPAAGDPLQGRKHWSMTGNDGTSLLAGWPVAAAAAQVIHGEVLHTACICSAACPFRNVLVSNVMSTKDTKKDDR